MKKERAKSSSRGVWKGNLSFGLVSIPVSVLPAEAPKPTSEFELVDRRDRAPVGYQKINKRTGEPIKDEDIVKALKVGKDKLEVFEAGEIEKLRVPGTREIGIERFVERDAIAPLYFARPYYLVPDKGGEKTYILLREVLHRKGRVALGEIVLHTKQHLVLIGESGPVLTLNLLRYAEDVRQPQALDLPAALTRPAPRFSASEMTTAERLVDEMTDRWKPTAFRDDFARHVVTALRKREQGEHATNAEAPTAPPVLDLVPRLHEKSKRAPHGNPSKRHA